MVKKKRVKIMLSVLSAVAVAGIPMAVVACGSSSSSSSSQTEAQQDMVTVVYGDEFNKDGYTKTIDGYVGPTYISTNYTSTTDANTPGIISTYSYVATDPKTVPQLKKVDVMIGIAKRPLPKYTNPSVQVTLSKGSVPQQYPGLPNMGSNYGTWSSPTYQKTTDKSVITSTNILNMAVGDSFEAVYTAKMTETKNHTGEDAVFTVDYKVGTTVTADMTAAYSIEYGKPLAYAVPMDNYSGPTQTGTNYSQTTPAGTQGIYATYEYNSRTASVVPAKVTVRVAITVTKQTLAAFSRSTTFKIAKGQEPGRYSALPTLPSGYEAWGQAEFKDSNANPIDANQIKALNENDTFTGTYTAGIADTTNYTGTGAKFVVNYTVSTASQNAQADEQQAYPIEYGSVLNFNDPKDGYAGPTYKPDQSTYTTMTPAGTANIHATYEYNTSDPLRLPQKITLVLNITVTKKQLAPFDQTIEEVAVRGKTFADYASLPTLPSSYAAWSQPVYKDSTGATMSKPVTINYALGTKFSATYTAAVSNPNNYAGTTATFHVNYTVSDKEKTNPTANTDAVTQRTVADPVDPTEWQTKPKAAKLQEVADLLTEGRKTKAEVNVSKAPSGAKTALVMPGELEFSGDNGQAALKSVKLDADVASQYTFKLYKLNTDGSLSALGDPTNPPTGTFALSNGDKVVMLAKETSTNTLVQGTVYDVAGLNEVLANISVFKDPLSEKIQNKTASLEEIFQFMDNLTPGKVYTSTLAQTGDKMNAIRIPDAAKMKRALDVPEKRREKNGLYSPFVDSSLAVGVQNANYSALYKFEALNLGFVQTSVKKVGGYMAADLAWGGNVVIDDVDKTSNGFDSDGWQQLKFLYDLRSNGVDAAISFGGLSGVPISNLYDPILLAKVLEEFVKGTNSTRIDYDIEGGDANDVKGMKVLAEATALVQQKLLAQGKHLEVGLTLASEYFGLADGKKALDAFVANGVVLRYVNGMTMMMNSGVTAGKTIAAQQEMAIDALMGQVKGAYADNGLNLTDEQAYMLVGATPDIGTDTWTNEVMQPSDIEPLYQMLSRKKIGYFGYWNVQAFLTSVHGLGGYMSGSTIGATFADGTTDPTYKWDPSQTHVFPDTIAKLNTDPNWSSYDPSYFGVGAYTNATTRSKLLTDIVDRYTSNGGAADQSNVLTVAEATGIILQGGTLFEWTSPVDKLIHVWRAAYYAETSQRPDNTTNGQFVDLGVSDRASNAKKQQARDAFQKLAGSYFGIAGDATSGLQAELNSDGSVSILVYDPTTNFAKAGVYTILDGKLYVTKYWAGAGSDPKTNAAWQEVTITE